MSQDKTTNFVELTADIVSAFVSNNSVQASDLPGILHTVHSALVSAVAGPTEAPALELKPAISVRKSITPDFLICLEDGKKFKSLKRHLRTTYGMTPDEYREKWGLPKEYPMVAPNYAQARSNLAKTMGLGQRRAAAAAAAAAASASATKAPAPAKAGAKRPSRKAEPTQ